MAHKHKNPNPDPIIQVSPIEYFSQDPETMPDWLKNHQGRALVRIRDIWDSRVVYYPGSYIDMIPIYLFSTTHAAHTFVYVDYGLSSEKLVGLLTDNIFPGYHLHHEQAVSQKELSPRTPHYHATEEEMAFAVSGYDMSISSKDAFAFLQIYQRDEGYGEDHGVWRFALLYIAADANATYDVLFGNSNISPYACVTCSNMGSGYSSFGRGSLLEKIAERTECFPQYLLCVEENGWGEYRMLRTVSGTLAGDGQRFIWKIDDGTLNPDDFIDC